MFEVRIVLINTDASFNRTGTSSSSLEAYCETYEDAHRALDSLLEIHGIEESEDEPVQTTQERIQEVGRVLKGHRGDNNLETLDPHEGR